MKKIKALFLVSLLVLTGCSRDLSSTTYVSDATLNIVLEGVLVSSREITIKDTDRVGDNVAGTAIGGIGGALAGNAAGGSGAAIAGAVAGGVFGAFTQSALSSERGIEYIVKIDRTQLKDDYYEGSAAMRHAIAASKATGVVTVIQSKEREEGKKPQIGDNVLVIISEHRSRVIKDLSK